MRIRFRANCLSMSVTMAVYGIEIFDDMNSKLVTIEYYLNGIYLEPASFYC